MSTPDISRFLRQPQKHYSGVRLQQGRVLTDADFNEAAYLGEAEQRSALLDLIGPKGSPDEGFSLGRPMLVAQGAAIPNQVERLRIGDPLPATVTVLLAGQPTRVRPIT